MPTSDGPLSIDRDGQITQNGKPIGRLGVYNVDNPASLTKLSAAISLPQARMIRCTRSTRRFTAVSSSNVQRRLHDRDGGSDGRAAADRSQRQHDPHPGFDVLQLLVDSDGKIS